MTLLFGLFFGFLCWICGVLGIPQRWLPGNPLMVALEKEKKRLEVELVANMIRAPAVPAPPAPVPVVVVK